MIKKNGGEIMESKNILWSISLSVIGIVTSILIGFNLVEIELPDIITRIFSLMELIALPVLAFSTVKKIKHKA